MIRMAVACELMVVPSCELTYPLLKVLLKMRFLLPRWDMDSFPAG